MYLLVQFSNDSRLIISCIFLFDVLFFINHSGDILLLNLLLSSPSRDVSLRDDIGFVG